MDETTSPQGDRIHRADYVQEFGPPPVPFDEYAAISARRFAELLAKRPSEAEVQEFLERNPALVPGAWTPGGNSGHPPDNHFLFTQPLLPGLDARRPDFMWIAGHSDTVFPTLIEIESPTKKLFTKNGQPTAEFTQARNQLSQWKAWFASPENIQKFRLDYGLASYLETRRLKPHFILVFGRRDEFAESRALTQLRAQLMAEDEELISYDRLAPGPHLEDAVTVVAAGDGKWRARAVAPTFGLTPVGADRLLVLEGLEDVIRGTEGITADRAAFLTRRIAYWREWESRQSGTRMYSAWDRE